MSIMAGADSCEWLYQIALGEEIDTNAIKVDDKAMFVRFDDSVRVR